LSGNFCTSIKERFPGQRDRLSGITIRIELPVISPAPEKSAAAAVPGKNGNLNRSLKLARTPHKYPAPAGRLTNAGIPASRKVF